MSKVASDTAPGVRGAASKAAADEMRRQGFSGGWDHDALIDAILAALAASPTASDTDTAIPGGEEPRVPEDLRDFASLMVDEVIAKTRIALDAGESLSIQDQRHMLNQLIVERDRIAAASPKPDTDAKRLVFDGDSLGDHERKGVPYTDTPVDPGVEGVREAEEVERDIRIAIWNAGMASAMGQNRTQAFIRRAMAEPMMARALAALAAKPIAGMDAGEVEDA